MTFSFPEKWTDDAFVESISKIKIDRFITFSVIQVLAIRPIIIVNTSRIFFIETALDLEGWFEACLAPRPFRQFPCPIDLAWLRQEPVHCDCSSDPLFAQPYHLDVTLREHRRLLLLYLLQPFEPYPQTIVHAGKRRSNLSCRRPLVTQQHQQHWRPGRSLLRPIDRALWGRNPP